MYSRSSRVLFKVDERIVKPLIEMSREFIRLTRVNVGMNERFGGKVVEFSFVFVSPRDP